MFDIPRADWTFLRLWAKFREIRWLPLFSRFSADPREDLREPVLSLTATPWIGLGVPYLTY